MVNWLLVSAFTFAASTCISLLMLRRLLRSPAPLFCSCSDRMLEPKHAVVTGATTGIGLATAVELARRNWGVTIACRDVGRGEIVRQQIIKDFGNANIEVRKLDMLDFDSIRQFADNFNAIIEPSIDVLIQNAGIMANTCRLVGDSGIDSNMMTNAVGPVFLLKCLWPHFKATAKQQAPRIIFVSSSLGARGNLALGKSMLLARPSSPKDWTARQSYANSKQALNLCARMMHKHFGESLDVYTLVTGGMVNTDLNREVIQNLPMPLRWLAKSASEYLLKSPLEGCQSVLHCAISSDVQNAHIQMAKEKSISSVICNGQGLLYRNCVPIEWPASSQSEDLAEAVFGEIEDLISSKI